VPLHERRPAPAYATLETLLATPPSPEPT
jgi:hypothetical protein